MNPFVGLVRTVLLIILGRVRFFKGSKGREFIMEDGERFTVFRHVYIMSSNKKLGEPKAIFKIRFQPADISVEQNIRFSLIPMMIFMGFKGFRSKFWMVNKESGLCQGIYEWQTIEDAVNYSKSIAVSFMQKRSVPSTVTFEIIPQNDDKYWVFR